MFCYTSTWCHVFDLFLMQSANWHEFLWANWDNLSWLAGRMSRRFKPTRERRRRLRRKSSRKLLQKLPSSSSRLRSKATSTFWEPRWEIPKIKQLKPRRIWNMSATAKRNMNDVWHFFGRYFSQGRFWQTKWFKINLSDNQQSWTSSFKICSFVLKAPRGSCFRTGKEHVETWMQEKCCFIRLPDDRDLNSLLPDVMKYMEQFRGAAGSKSLSWLSGIVFFSLLGGKGPVSKYARWQSQSQQI